MSTTEGTTLLLASLQAIAEGAATEDVRSLPAPAVPRAWCNRGCHTDAPADAALGDIVAVSELAPGPLRDHIWSVCASQGTCTTAVINAAVEVCKATNDFDPLTQIFDALASRGIACAETHLTVALMTAEHRGGDTRAALIVKALDAAEGDFAQAWSAVDEFPFVYRGESFADRTAVLLRAVRCRSALPAHWYELALLLGADGAAPRGGAVTQVSALCRCLRLDSSFAEAYYALALAMPNVNEPVEFQWRGSMVHASCAWLLGQAITHACSAIDDAWYALMHTIGDRSDVTVSGTTVDLADCCSRVIDLGGSRADEAWELLLGCFSRDGDGHAAGSSSVAVRADVSRVVIAANLVRRKPTDSTAWMTLASALESSSSKAHHAVIDGKKVSAAVAYANAVHYGAEGVRVWVGAARNLNPGQEICLGARRFTLLEAAWRAVQIRDCIEHWELFTPLFDRAATLRLPDGSELTDKAWCVHILERNISHRVALYRLAKALGSGGDAALLNDGRTLTVRNCLTDCLKLDPTFVAAWSLLADTMAANETSLVNGVTMSRSEVAAKAKNCGTYDVAANWAELGRSLAARRGTSMIANRRVNAADCFRKVLQLDPGNHDAARALDDFEKASPTS
jgi:hypothetical protein